MPTEITPGGRSLVVAQIPGLGARSAAGQPYRGAISLQWLDPELGGDHRGSPRTPGTLTLDLVWEFAASLLAGAVVTESRVLEATVVAEGTQATFEWNGLIPAPPETPGGLQTTHLSRVRLVVGDGTTASGLASVGLDLVLDLQHNARSSQ